MWAWYRGTTEEILRMEEKKRKRGDKDDKKRTSDRSSK
jgi:hypothetical protein